MKKTLYSVLGVDSLAPQELIEEAYRLSLKKLEKLSESGHPELQSEIVIIKEAYLTLSVPEKRAAYDQKLREESASPQPTVIYQYQAEPENAFVAWWHSSKTSVLVIGILLVLAAWVGLGYFRASKTAEVFEKAIDESVKVQEIAVTSQSDDRAARELQRQEQRKRDLELQQERDHARQYEQRRREEQRAEQRAEQTQAQKAEYEKRKEEYARQQREREANMRADRERRYYACLNPAIDQYGVERAQLMCANYR